MKPSSSSSRLPAEALAGLQEGAVEFLGGDTLWLKAKSEQPQLNGC